MYHPESSHHTLGRTRCPFRFVYAFVALLNLSLDRLPYPFFQLKHVRNIRVKYSGPASANAGGDSGRLVNPEHAHVASYSYYSPPGNSQHDRIVCMGHDKLPWVPHNELIEGQLDP
jgi:hypothetical protein